jgi:transcriptional repressor NrdR
MSLKVVKKHGGREPFSREKMRQGLARACWKRPISDEQIDGVIARVETEVYANFDSEVESEHLGALVIRYLGELDQVAFVRFASVYREFKDVRDFVDELQPMLMSQRPGDA